MPYYHSPILYIIHCKKWKYSQYLRLYISELNSKMVCFLFGKTILNIRSLSYKNLKRVHHKFSMCRSTLSSNHMNQIRVIPKTFTLCGALLPHPLLHMTKEHTESHLFMKRNVDMWLRFDSNVRYNTCHSHSLNFLSYELPFYCRLK